ncbi:NADP-dependent oxidoreductase [Pontibacter silvestris]|uniref:NADP-dependent oxidoreductase n=1 Tax=Pontibacter silvestris TaxID=2305183 RepID=A0ABW4X279_9BACT|nr:NADP-dependent oxidoreductase [Pontibacter silvestris]MCC9136061.1 NADP-dependent oxidoreductase [Pontibacter silvestris]
MKAIILPKPGGVENFQIKEIEKPVPQKNEVLVKVKAISINPVDTKTREGKAAYDSLKDNNPLILGWDISGEVEAVGDEVEYFKAGDEVFGMVNFPGHGKAYAEYVTAPEGHLAHKPAQVSFEEAAATTLAALTAWQVLVHEADVQPGQRVLIHAAAGGVGHFAVQIAKYFQAYVIGTASAQNHDFLKSIGVDEPIDYKNQNVEDVVKDVDVVLDSLGEENTRKSLKTMKDGGKIISILRGATDEVKAEAKKRNIQAKNHSVKSSGEDETQLAELLMSGKIKPYIAQTYGFEDIADAHEKVASRTTNGKVIIRVS